MMPSRLAGRCGREARGGGGAGALILPVAGEGVRRGRPLFRPRSGEQEGDAGGGGGLGRGAGGGPAWAGGGLGRGSSGGEACSFFLLTVLFSVFSYLFISFFVLFHLKVFRHFIKM